VLSPESNVQRAIDSSAEGTTFLLRAGTYKLLRVRAKWRQIFVGETGTVLTGARPVVGYHWFAVTTQ
jgi:hypothetical protein